MGMVERVESISVDFVPLIRRLSFLAARQLLMPQLDARRVLVTLDVRLVIALPNRVSRACTSELDWSPPKLKSWTGKKYLPRWWDFSPKGNLHKNFAKNHAWEMSQMSNCKKGMKLENFIDWWRKGERKVYRFIDLLNRLSKSNVQLSVEWSIEKKNETISLLLTIFSWLDRRVRENFIGISL